MVHLQEFPSQINAYCRVCAQKQCVIVNGWVVGAPQTWNLSQKSQSWFG